MDKNQDTDPQAATDSKSGLDFAGWLLAIPALIYATGFLVVFTAEERLGLIGIAGDFFKIRYMHVGMLCATFIALFAALAYMHRELTFKGKQENTANNGAMAFDLRAKHLLVIFPVIGGIYVQLTITPPGTFWGWPAFTLITFAFVTVGGAIALSPLRLTQPNHWVRRTWMVLVGVLGTAFLLAELLIVEWGRWGIWWKAALSVTILAVFAALIGRTLHRSVEGARVEQASGRRIVWWLIGVSFAGFFYYVDAYGFALAIYPHISIRKGGGDFCDAPTVIVYFAERADETVPANVLDGPHRTKPLVLLLETAEVIYAAEGAVQERCLWGKSAEDRPERIFEFTRSLVSAVELSTKLR